MMYRGVQLIWYKKNWYHPKFFKQGPICIKQAKYTCQRCGIKRGEEYITKEGNTARGVMQAAHLHHDPWNPKAKLICLCKPCHLWYDAPMHGEKGANTKKRDKREKTVEDNGQEELALRFRQKAVKLQKGMDKLIDDEWISEKLLEPPKKAVKQVIIVQQYLLLEE